MEIGKLPNDILEKIVFENIKYKREEVLVRAGIGEDNAIIDFGDDVCILSTDPITGTTVDIGSLAINISCNDVASSGAKPIGVLMTIMAPPETTEEDIRVIMEEAGSMAEKLNVEIVGGHTEITEAVNRIIISTTVIGKLPKKDIINPKTTQVGDKILMTKWAGIEGTSIIAEELKDELIEKIEPELIEEARSLNQFLSVVKEGVICGEIGVKYMHDVTEGGIFGAVWEAGQVIGKGVKIQEKTIPMKQSTKIISQTIGIDPYRLISSGSMLIIADSDKAEIIRERLNTEKIEVSIIGEVTENGIVVEKNGIIEEIIPPSSDELYRALSRVDS